ncbi:hypothetical protein [Pectinatus haikarae]|uniref:Uncharacterized protein n=1 Tax=Pectinatus haikarae TaxID=349096 RepID=A0ABT9Y8C9_9FIRM|nr:hypothetical protein [Pectinatus haikarae]MDQ0204097.1 hypothetical protein [Pectinatus haikarae]
MGGRVICHLHIGNGGDRDGGEQMSEKTISRAVMRGKSLDADCKRAKISRYEYGPNDNRCFCYGLIDLRTDCLIDKCIQCSAYACNATPLEDADNGKA